ncbi:MAG: hypothetical protein K2I14_02780 [Eubacterium sp.]|nr:hypothetical protein [Eubacterium sp.]
MAGKLSVKFKIILAVLIAVVLCAVSALVFKITVYQPDNMVFKGHSIQVSLSKERKKNYHIGLSSAVADDKPYAYNSEAMFYLKKLVYQPLLQMNNDGSLNYLNASKIIFKNSGTEAYVSVDSSVRFSNGERLSADIVLKSYEWFMKNETDFSDLLSNIASIEKSDDKTLIFYFKEVSLENIRLFNIPVVYFDENAKLALGTGSYAVESLVFYGDITLFENKYSDNRQKYEKVVLSPMNLDAADSLNENQDYDVFLMNKETQSDLINENGAYNIFEIGQSQGNYLIYNIENPSVRRAVSLLVSGEEFFESTQDSGAYSKGITSAYMKKPNYHSLIKKGNLNDIESLKIAYDYQGVSYSIYSALSEMLENSGVECKAENVEILEAEQKINADIIVYYGSLGDIVNSSDTKAFFDNYKKINAKNFNKNIEKYFADKNKIAPLSKDTVWYASLAGRDDLGLFD